VGECRYEYTRPGIYFSVELLSFEGVRSEVPSCVWLASVPVFPDELAFGVRSGDGLPGVRSEVLPWLPGSVFTFVLDEFVDVEESAAHASDAPIVSASALLAASRMLFFLSI
jgi:hypothetical protein